MSATVWPPLPEDRLFEEEKKSLASELKWLLDHLHENFALLKDGLEECVCLLLPQEPGSTLALSSVRSESIKGHVTRVGAWIVKGDIQLRLRSLPPPPGLSSYPIRIQEPFLIPQLSQLLVLLTKCVDIVEMSTVTGDPHNGPFIAGQLGILADTIDDARHVLKGGEAIVGGRWWEDHLQSTLEALPNVSVHFSIIDAALVLTLRTLMPVPEEHPSSSITGFISRRLGLLPAPAPHDEVDQMFEWGGKAVMVREKVRVESQDPTFISLMTKLNALAHGIAGGRSSLALVMGDAE